MEWSDKNLDLVQSKIGQVQFLVKIIGNDGKIG